MKKYEWHVQNCLAWLGFAKKPAPLPEEPKVVDKPTEPEVVEIVTPFTEEIPKPDPDKIIVTAHQTPSADPEPPTKEEIEESDEIVKASSTPSGIFFKEPEHDLLEKHNFPSVVKFENVTKVFRKSNGEEKVAIEDISFEVQNLPNTGELVTMVGQSGCGKSTILRIIAGLHPHFPPTSGTVTAMGKPIVGPSAQRGFVDQKYSLLPHLTVIENVAFGLKLRGGMKKLDRLIEASEWVKKVGLQGSENKYPHELSGGMQQRVSIAATLVLGPRIILMDEPFGALDPKTRLQMQALLVDLWKEQQSTVFFVTHSVEEAVYLGDRIYRLAANPGRLIEVLDAPRPDIPPEEMRKQPWFSDTVQELLNRLENESPKMGALPYPHTTPSCVA